MALGWDTAAAAQLAGGAVRGAVLLRVETDPVIRLWAGAGDLEIGADLVEILDQARYTGAGELLSPPQVNALVNGLAERVEFGLSGEAITPEVAAIASTEASAIRGAAVNLGFLVFDADFQILSPTAWVWDGVADSLKVSRDGGNGSPTRTLSLSVGSVFTGRQRPTLGVWSDAAQRRRSADDAFCQNVRRYEQSTTINWPI